jgi:ELWxxDGT repeat protein
MTETHGQELWRTNGTANGTKMVKDIWLGSQRVWAKLVCERQRNALLLGR